MNSGVCASTSIAAMREFAAKLTAQMNDIKWRIFETATSGNRVFLEGVDDFVTNEGRRVVLPYAGVLAFKGERISWATLARKRVLASLAASAASLAARRAASSASASPSPRSQFEIRPVITSP